MTILGAATLRLQLWLAILQGTVTRRLLMWPQENLRLMHESMQSQPLGPIIRFPTPWSTKPAQVHCQLLCASELARPTCWRLGRVKAMPHIFP